MRICALCGLARHFGAPHPAQIESAERPANSRKNSLPPRWFFRAFLATSARFDWLAPPLPLAASRSRGSDKCHGAFRRARSRKSRHPYECKAASGLFKPMHKPTRLDVPACSRAFEKQRSFLDKDADVRKRYARDRLRLQQAFTVGSIDGEGELEVLAVAERVLERRSAVAKLPGGVADRDFARRTGRRRNRSPRRCGRRPPTGRR